MIKRIFSLVALIGAIIVPLSASAASYIIERGDTLTSIAREFSVSINDIAIQNGIKNVNRIFAGDTLEINTDASIPSGDVLGGSGGAYTPVTGYQSRITTYISAAATTVPVASTKDKAGNQIVLADISSSSTAKVYLSLSTGTSKEEIVACTGLTTASWTGCSRGLSFQGGSMTASTTLAFAHNAGESVIITDAGQFFNEFVSVSGNQTIFDRKTFYSFPIVTSTTALPTLGSELASKYYVDTVGAGGFTASNVSTTRGLTVDGSAPERIGINASTTRGLAFDNNGTANRPLYITASSTGGINFASDGSLQVDQADNFTFTGTTRVTQAPSSANDIVNLTYSETELSTFSATGTASVPITAGQAIFATATSTIGVTNSTSGTSTYSFIGIARTTAAAGATVKYTRPGGINCDQSGLTPGASYMLNGTAGQIGSTPGTLFARIGMALSATCVQVIVPKYIISGSQTISSVTTYVQTTNFYPAKISIRAATTGGGTGGSIGDDTNTNALGFRSGTVDNDVTVQGAAWYVYDLSPNQAQSIGTVSAKSATGFTLNCTTDVVDTVVQWTAESL